MDMRPLSAQGKLVPVMHEATHCLDDILIGFCADTGKPYPLKEGKYENQTVSVGPTSTPEPEVSGKPQTAYA
jgi:hypothetical protein